MREDGTAITSDDEPNRHWPLAVEALLDPLTSGAPPSTSSSTAITFGTTDDSEWDDEGGDGARRPVLSSGESVEREGVGGRVGGRRGKGRRGRVGWNFF